MIVQTGLCITVSVVCSLAVGVVGSIAAISARPVHQRHSARDRSRFLKTVLAHHENYGGRLLYVEGQDWILLLGRMLVRSKDDKIVVDNRDDLLAMLH